MLLYPNSFDTSAFGTYVGIASSCSPASTYFVAYKYAPSIPYASTISVLVGFTALIPVFGAFIGTVFGAFLILMVDPGKAVLFVIFILVLQQIEGNLIYPKVVGKSVGLPGIWVLVAVTIGASVYGILGMLISVPLCSILYSIIRTNVNDKIDQKNKKKVKIKEQKKEMA